MAVSGVTLLVVMGLTGVGKSTAVAALTDTFTDTFTLLPNRRELTDALIIPAVQRADGLPLRAVTDRLERFTLTRRYRELHPGGMVEALQAYLQNAGDGPFVFDNLRGLDEARAAVSSFPNARFVLLDAPPLVRLSRLVGRHDPFDEVAAENLKSTSFIDQLLSVDGLTDVFDTHVLASWAADGVPESDLLKATRIIISESRNYDMGAAAEFLRAHKDAHGFLYLNTADLSAEAVQERIKGWPG